MPQGACRTWTKACLGAGQPCPRGQRQDVGPRAGSGQLVCSLQRWPSGNRLPRAGVLPGELFPGPAGPQSHPQEASKARLSEMGGGGDLLWPRTDPLQKYGGTP